LRSLFKYILFLINILYVDDGFFQLRDQWIKESTKEGSNGRVEILSWLSKMTLDVIGLAGACLPLFLYSLYPNFLIGFNYSFDALSDKKSELNEAFSTIFRSGTRLSLIPIIKGMFPALRWLVSNLYI
jgi:hypothetical protein